MTVQASCHPDRPRYRQRDGLCQGCYDAQRYPLERQRRIEYSRTYRARHPERSRANAQSAQRRRLYGMEPGEYEAMLAAQGGTCAICGRPETGRGRSGQLIPLAVDHDHKTGAIRALLCGQCNNMVGRAEDDPERLEAAAAYLRAFR